jgi:putative colanic acid biosynthesis glycosyltransferase
LKILQINTTVNSGSTGRIAEDIGNLLLSRGHISYIAYSRSNRPSTSRLIKIGNNLDIILHGIKTILFDRHGFASLKATGELINKTEQISPDLIHLHNIHGYYLNIKVLFDYLKKRNMPVVWTLHDCWPFTGHCSFFDSVNCMKWQTACFDCPNTHGYPESWFLDNSRKNFIQKKDLFNGLGKMTLIAPSKWLANHLSNSFLKKYQVKIIHNGVNLDKFKPVDREIARKKYDFKGKRIVLGVANLWDRRKGFKDFIMLRSMLKPEFEIVLVGLSARLMKSLPSGITGIARTESIDDLASIYSSADVFVNPTYVDNFPAVNLEALACGTPIVTYNTGGSPEACDEETGLVVERGSVLQLTKAIESIIDGIGNNFSLKCRDRAVRLYDKNQQFNDYLKVYQETSEYNK